VRLVGSAAARGASLAANRRASGIAEKEAPYGHAKLNAVKLAGDPNNPVRFKDDATAEELRAEMMRRIAEMRDGLPPGSGLTDSNAETPRVTVIT
jgi:hypothetical protein